jgi:hypothetical protein
METREKEKIYDFQLIWILSFILIIFVFSGCASGDKGHRIRRIDEIPENRVASDFPDELTANKLPEITSDEYEKLGDALLRKGNLHLAFMQYERSLRLNPDNIRVEYKKGLTLLFGKK